MRGRKTNGKVEFACAQYEVLKEEARKNGYPMQITMRTIEKRFGLKRKQIENYRTNHGLRFE